MPRAATHPSPVELAAFASGRLSPEEQAALEEHISACDLCCRQLSEAPDDTLLVSLRGAGTRSEQTVDQSPPRTNSRPTIPPELIDHPRYRVEQLLGSGGMGDVFKAEHRMMQRPVALKVIRQQLTSNPAALERFELEVRAAGKLLHPNIVAAHDADQAGDLHFLVMEYVDGISLDRYVQHQGRMKVDEAVRVTRQVATGLQHAHEMQMVHRDIKPQNVMVTRKSQVKILDFGLAKFFREQQDIAPLNAGTPSRPDLTTDGLILGTPDYIAPEQITNSKTADVRADIYSLGCTLYYMLAGRPPFATGTSVDKMLAHTRQQATPLSQIRDDVSPELSSVVERMMAKNPAERFQEPREVAKALQPFVKAGGTNVVAGPQDLQPLSPLHLLSPDLLQQAPAIVPSLPRAKPEGFKPSQQQLIIAGGTAAALVLLLLVAYLVAGRGNGEPKGSNRPSASGGQNLVSPVPPNVADTPQPTPVANVPEVNKHHVLFVVPKDGIFWRDFEPVRRQLEGRGVAVEIASSSRGPCGVYESKDTVAANHEVKSVNARGFDAILFCGFKVDELCAGGVAGEATKQLIETFRKDRKIVAAICTGQRVLLSHGELTGKQAATLLDNNQNALPPEQAARVNWQERPVVRDGQLITARGPDDAVAFAKMVADALPPR